MSTILTHTHKKNSGQSALDIERDTQFLIFKHILFSFNFNSSPNNATIALKSPSVVTGKDVAKHMK